MQWRNSNFAAVPHRPTAAAAGAQVRLLENCPKHFSPKNNFFVQNPVLQHFELIAANLQLFEPFDKNLKKKKFEKKSVLKILIFCGRHQGPSFFTVSRVREIGCFWDNPVKSTVDP